MISLDLVDRGSFIHSSFMIVLLFSTFLSFYHFVHLNLSLVIKRNEIASISYTSPPHTYTNFPYRPKHLVTREGRRRWWGSHRWSEDSGRSEGVPSHSLSPLVPHPWAAAWQAVGFLYSGDILRRVPSWRQRRKASLGLPDWNQGFCPGVCLLRLSQNSGRRPCDFTDFNMGCHGLSGVEIWCLTLFCDVLAPRE